MESCSGGPQDLSCDAGSVSHTTPLLIAPNHYFGMFSLFSFTFQITEAGFLAHVFIPTTYIYISLRKQVGFTSSNGYSTIISEGF